MTGPITTTTSRWCGARGRSGDADKPGRVRRGTPWRARRAACALAAALVGAVSLSGVAVADDAADGRWYLDDYGVPGGWAKGYDGSGVTIALIDSPIDPSVPWLAGADIEYFDNPLCTAQQYGGTEPLAGSTSDQLAAYHGTTMVGFYVGNGDDGNGGPAIQGVAPKARVLILPHGIVTSTIDTSYYCYPRRGLDGAELAEFGATYQDMASKLSVRAPALAVQIERAIEEGADIIHLPFGLTDITPGSFLEAALLHAQQAGVILVTARSNYASDRLDYVSSAPYDIGYFPGTLTVSSLDRDDSVSDYVATQDPGVDILAPGGMIWTHHGTESDLDAYFESRDGGTSTASAIMSGYLALLMSKYPDATGNQILHAVISSTLDGKGKAIRDPNDVRGWGSFTFEYATQTDPTTYPDTNPIFDYDLQRITDHYDNYNRDDWDTTGMDDAHLPSRLADWERMVGFSPEGDTLEDYWPNIMAYYAELQADAGTTSEPTSEAAPDTTADAGGVPVWVWIAAGGGLLLIGAVAGLAVALSRRRKPQPAVPPPPPPPYHHQGR